MLITRLILVLADRMNVSIRSVGHGKVKSLKPREIAKEQYNVAMRCDEAIEASHTELGTSPKTHI